MRILHILPTLEMAGAESLVVNILKNVNRPPHEVRLCVLYPSFMTNLEYELLKAGIPIYFLDKRKGFDLRMFGRIGWVLNKFKPDVVHTHGYIVRYTLLPTLLNLIPVGVHTLHTLAEREVSFLAQFFHFVAFRFFNIIPVCVTESVAVSVRRTYGVSPYVIYNGIPINRFENIKISSRQRQQETIFVNISGFRPVKNHRLLINAFTEVAAKRDRIKLILAGDGLLRADMETLVQSRGLGNKIVFLGLRDDIPQLLEKSDIYVSSSDWEGFGLSIVEAMAAGRPVIATGVGGIPEIVENSVTGILVPPRAQHALASAMITLVDNRDLRTTMGIHGRRRVAEQFDIIKTSRKYEELYRMLYTKRLLLQSR